MARTILAVLLALACARARAQGPRGPPPDARPPAAAPEARPPAKSAEPGAKAEARGAPLPRGAILEEVSGTVRDVDRKGHRIEVEAGDQRVTLSLDRNTMVYTPAGLGTVLDVIPGAQIRAGRNAEFLAYWVQVRAPARSSAPSTPGQGTGPAGGAAAPATESGAPGAPAPPGGAGTTPGGPGPGGGVAPGP
jgi:hypothetical protein